MLCMHVIQYKKVYIWFSHDSSTQLRQEWTINTSFGHYSHRLHVHEVMTTQMAEIYSSSCRSISLWIWVHDKLRCNKCSYGWHGHMQVSYKAKVHIMSILTPLRIFFSQVTVNSQPCYTLRILLMFRILMSM